MAPEVDKTNAQAGYCPYYADVFSYGCVIYFLSTGNEEWEGEKLREVSEKNKLS